MRSITRVSSEVVPSVIEYAFYGLILIGIMPFGAALIRPHNWLWNVCSFSCSLRHATWFTRYYTTCGPIDLRYCPLLPYKFWFTVNL